MNRSTESNRTWVLTEHPPIKSGKPVIDLTGRRCGKLTVLIRYGSFIHKGSGARKPAWLCACECGNTTIVGGQALREETTRSCGCLTAETLSNRARGKREKRGLPDNFQTLPAYESWRAMRERCSNPNNTRYASYGGRGITYPKSWELFEKFYVDMGDRPEGTSLDRVDVNSNYSKANCRWADATTQARNARSNRVITFNGERKLLCEWAEDLGITQAALRYRLRCWDKEAALTTYGRTTLGGPPSRAQKEADRA